MIKQPSKFVKVIIPLAIAIFMSGLCVDIAIAQGPIASQNYDLSYAKGLVAFDSERYEEAEALFRMALEAKPGDPDASYYLGQTLLRAKKFQEAKSVFRTLLDADPTSGRTWLGLGIVQYNQEAYQATLTSLAFAEERLPKDPLIPYYQGLAYYKLKAYEGSVDQFALVLSLSMELAPAAHYYRGIGYLRQGYLEKAKPEFEAVIEADPGSVLARSATDFLTIAKEGTPEEPKWWNLEMSVSNQYDTNVVLLPTGSSPPGGTTGISGQKDYRTVLYARGEVRVQETPRWILGGSYGLYQSFHRTLSGFDVQAHTPTVFLQYKTGPLQGRLNFIYDRVFVGREPYLDGLSVQPVLTFTEGKWGFIQAEFRYQNKDFKNDRFANNDLRNGKNYRVGFTQYFLFADWGGHARLGYMFDAELTGGGSPATATAGVQSAADWAYQGHRLTVGLGVPPIKKIGLDLGFVYYRQDYDNPNSFSGTGTLVREDDIFSFTGTASRNILPNLSAALQYTYVRDQANISDFDYTRTIYSLTLTGTFDGQF